MFELMQRNGDYTHFYFAYRWLLLDFKRELSYEDVYRAWETIWSAQYMCSPHFTLFIALALVDMYRDLLLANNMDFTDLIKFFNGLLFWRFANINLHTEMAERHDVVELLHIARGHMKRLKQLVDNQNE